MVQTDLKNPKHQALMVRLMLFQWAYKNILVEEFNYTTLHEFGQGLDEEGSLLGNPSWGDLVSDICKEFDLLDQTAFEAQLDCWRELLDMPELFLQVRDSNEHQLKPGQKPRKAQISKRTRHEIYLKCFTDMIRINPEMLESHVEEDFVIENFLDRVSQEDKLLAGGEATPENIDRASNWFMNSKKALGSLRRD